MPQSAVQDDSHVYVDAMTQVKYSRKFYDAEILKLSCECFCFLFAYVLHIIAEVGKVC